MSIAALINVLVALLIVDIVLLIVFLILRKLGFWRRMENAIIFYITTILIATFLFLFIIVLVTLRPINDEFEKNFPYLYNIGNLTSEWISIWLSLFGVLSSIATAIIAIVISLQQDKLVKFQHESTIVPLLESQKIICEDVPKIVLDNLDICKKYLCFGNNYKYMAINMYLKNSHNPHIQYSTESLEVYNGLYSLTEICKKSAKPLHTFCENTKELHLFARQNDNGFFLQNMIAIDSKNSGKDILHCFENLKCPKNQKDDGAYTLVFKMSARDTGRLHCYDYKFRFLVNLVNEKAFFGDLDSENNYIVYSAEHK